MSFISYEYLKYLGYDQETKKYSFLYKIIDSEFEEEKVEVAASALVLSTASAFLDGDALFQAAVIKYYQQAAVIKYYQQRGYSHPQIAKQIFLCLRYTSQKYDYSMNQLVSWQKKYNTELWEKYGQEINKFLLFS